MVKLKFKRDILKSSKKSIFDEFFYNVFFYNCYFIYTKMSKYLSAKYYKENKERLQERARERDQNFSKKERGKKWQYGCEHYKNLSEDKRQKLVEWSIEKSLIE